MDGRMDGWTDGWMVRWMDGKKTLIKHGNFDQKLQYVYIALLVFPKAVDGWMDGWMNGWIDRKL